MPKQWQTFKCQTFHVRHPGWRGCHVSCWRVAFWFWKVPERCRQPWLGANQCQATKETNTYRLYSCGHVIGCLREGRGRSALAMPSCLTGTNHIVLIVMRSYWIPWWNVNACFYCMQMLSGACRLLPTLLRRANMINTARILNSTRTHVHPQQNCFALLFITQFFFSFYLKRFTTFQCENIHNIHGDSLNTQIG